MKVVFILLISYILGAIPFAYIVSNIFGKIDIRKKGSGNIGATNVLRVLGPLPGILVLVLDLLKGFLAVKVAGLYLPKFIYLAGFLVVIGHCWTIFLKFKGGKGVATTLGVILAINPNYLIYMIIIWFIVFLIFKIVSLASVTSAFLLPIILVLKKVEPKVLIFIGIYCGIIILRHRENIKRILAGQEKRVSISRE